MQARKRHRGTGRRNALTEPSPISFGSSRLPGPQALESCSHDCALQVVQFEGPQTICNSENMVCVPLTLFAATSFADSFHRHCLCHTHTHTHTHTRGSILKPSRDTAVETLRDSSSRIRICTITVTINLLRHLAPADTHRNRSTASESAPTPSDQLLAWSSTQILLHPMHNGFQSLASCF